MEDFQNVWLPGLLPHVPTSDEIWGAILQQKEVNVCPCSWDSLDISHTPIRNSDLVAHIQWLIEAELGGLDYLTQLLISHIFCSTLLWGWLKFVGSTSLFDSPSALPASFPSFPQAWITNTYPSPQTPFFALCCKRTQAVYSECKDSFGVGFQTLLFFLTHSSPIGYHPPWWAAIQLSPNVDGGTL